MTLSDKLESAGKQESAGRRTSSFRLLSAKDSGSALLYMLLSLACIGFALTIADRFIIPMLEDSGTLTSWRWKEQDGWLLEQGRRKNLASDDCSVWRSAGWPVSEKKPKSTRILVMGDSFAWGTGYPNMNTLWWRQLQKVLNDRGYNDVEVIAAGMPAQSTAAQLVGAKKIIGKYKPDLVIWGYVTNDPDEVAPDGKHIVPIMRSWNIPPDNLPAPVKNSLESLFPNLAWHLFDIRQNARAKNIQSKETGWDYGTWELKLLEGPNFEKYAKTLEKVAQFQKTVNLPFFFITLPAGYQAGDAQRSSLRTGAGLLTRMQEYHIERYGKVQTLFDKSGLHFFNTLNDVLSGLKGGLNSHELSSLQLGISPANGHPAASLCHLYAESAANILEKNYPGILGNKKESKTVAPLLSINDWMPHSLLLNRLADGRYLFYAPQSEKDALFLPIRKPYLQLNFEIPTELSRLRLLGAGLKRAEIYLVAENQKLGYDEQLPRRLGERKGSALVFDLPKEQWTKKISSILISADITGSDRRVLLELNPDRKATH
ncbi:MAG: hypothetical protein C0469_06645 [Cyanobacteria bacterium DS2.3.42]|nr:hypothetical protein [Cyanobacteria bacterium DS2.3.42]